MDRFEIYIADVPFQETDGEKLRPALIVADMGDYVKILKITTKGKTRKTHYPLVDSVGAGLDEKSYIEYESFFDIDKKRIGKRLGQLTYIDEYRMQQYIVLNKKY